MKYHPGGLGDLDFLTEGIGGLSAGGVPPMGASMGPPMGGMPPFGVDPGLSDLFGLQTGPSVIGGGPVVLPKQVSVIVISNHWLIDHNH